MSSEVGRAVRAFAWPRALLAVVASALVVGVPTDVIENDFFTRMTPVRSWEYPVLALTAVLTGLWVGIRRQSGAGAAPVAGTSVLSALAVGCPVCNKIVVALLGISGALSIWAPVQPVLAVLSLTALAAAVVIRWRRRDCPTEACTPAERLRALRP
jgi:hypothetical protein